MTIEQIVDVPAARRLVIEVPREIPPGRTILAFTPAPAGAGQAETALPQEDAGEDPLPFGWGSGPPMTAREAIERCRGIAKGSGFTSERLFEYRREDAELEEAQYRRLFHHEEDTD